MCRRWNRATDEISQAILTNIDTFNPIYMMANSGARGTPRQISQIAGMRGLMADPFGRFIEDLPIKSNFHEGLNVLEYFVSTHGGRKGLADTALRTADAGYLTRRLVDVAQDVIIRELDCGTANGIWVAAIRSGSGEIEPLEKRIDGRIIPQDIVDPRTDRIILRTGQEISDNTDQPCPACTGQLQNFYQCPTCSELMDEHEVVDLYFGDQLGLEESLGESLAAEATQAETAETEEERPELTEGTAPATTSPVPTALLLEEVSCSKCGGALELLKVCRDCGEQFRARDVMPALTRDQAHRGRVRYFPARGEEPQGRTSRPDGSRRSVHRQGAGEEGRRSLRYRGRQAAQVGPAVVGQGRAGARGEVQVRSPLTCEMTQGICAACYGRDFATGRLVEVGEAGGIIAAQSIGEPGTQLTMRTFHTGGVAGQYLTGVAQVKENKKRTLEQFWGDVKAGIVRLSPKEEGEGAPKAKPVRARATGVTKSGAPRRTSLDTEQRRVVQQLVRVMEEQVKGLLRVVELFEARRPKGQAIISEVDGTVARIEVPGVKWVIVHSNQPVDTEHPEKLYGEVLAEDIVASDGHVIASAGAELTPPVIAALVERRVREVPIERRHLVPYRGVLPVREGDQVRAGDALTEGPLDPQKVLQMQGVRAVQEYVVKEIQSVYASHGVSINDKHIEVIVRQMLRKRRILDSGDTELLPGKIYDRFHFDAVNEGIRERGGAEATAEWVLLGITEASLATDSFLSAASFQKTTRVLTEAAIQGKVDNLIGLKENVIIGRLIPAGTGMTRYRSLRVQGPPGEEALRASASRAEADLLRSAFGEMDLGNPEEDLIRDLADINPIAEDEDEEEGEDLEDTAVETTDDTVVDDDAAI